MRDENNRLFDASTIARVQPLPNFNAELIDLGEMTKQSRVVFVCPGLPDARG
jgi:hypothetical protein